MYCIILSMCVLGAHVCGVRLGMQEHQKACCIHYKIFLFAVISVCRNLPFRIKMHRPQSVIAFTLSLMVIGRVPDCCLAI